MPSIQQSAALALGRLANYSDDLAEAVVGNEILPQLVYSLSEQNRLAPYLPSMGALAACTYGWLHAAASLTKKSTIFPDVLLQTFKGRDAIDPPGGAL